MNYYNELDPYAAQWLRNLIDARHIPFGHVDTRSIEDVTPADLAGYTQCHFFAGIGGWSLALQLAGWPADRPVWTGSCPCQPFSAAGKGAGFADERHLWPAWQHLINQCHPAVIFGEQVASKAVDAWIDLVHADMEGMGYAFGCVPFPAAGIGAPHIRDRNYWVADASSEGLAQRERNAGILGWSTGADSRQAIIGNRIRDAGGLADSYGREQQRLAVVRGHERDGTNAGWTQGVGSSATRHEDGEGDRAGPTNGLWRAADWLACTDGKWRPVEPGTFPLAHGVPNRVGRLRAYGNAIVPSAIAEFIKAYLACQS